MERNQTLVSKLLQNYVQDNQNIDEDKLEKIRFENTLCFRAWRKIKVVDFLKPSKFATITLMDID